MIHLPIKLLPEVVKLFLQKGPKGTSHSHPALLIEWLTYQVSQSFKEYLLNANKVPDTVPGAGATMVTSVDMVTASRSVQPGEEDRLQGK